MISFINPLAYKLFFKSFIKEGKKNYIYKVAHTVMQKIRMRKWRYYGNHQTFSVAFKNLITPVRVRRKKIASQIELVPSLIKKPRRTFGVAARWLRNASLSSHKKQKSCLEDKIAIEIGFSHNRSGLAYYEKRLLEWQVQINKKNMRFLQKRKGGSRETYRTISQLKLKKMNRKKKKIFKRRMKRRRVKKRIIKRMFNNRKFIRI